MDKITLFKKSYINKLRKELKEEAIKRYGNISDEEFEKIFMSIIEKEENEIKKGLQKELPKAFWFPLYEMAEKGDVIVEIDGRDIGMEVRQLRGIYEWLKQRRKYFGGL